MLVTLETVAFAIFKSLYNAVKSRWDQCLCLVWCYLAMIRIRITLFEKCVWQVSTKTYNVQTSKGVNMQMYKTYSNSKHKAKPSLHTIQYTIKNHSCVYSHYHCLDHYVKVYSLHTWRMFENGEVLQLCFQEDWLVLFF